MRKRTGYTLLVVFLILSALAAAVYLREEAPPEVARLLPESDAIVYLNLKPLRAATHFDRSPVQPSPAYQQFIQATGIVPERDLDQAAFALHRMADPSGPNGPVAFTEVFSGHFDTPHLAQYLDAISTARETYADHIVYAVLSEGRTLRVTLLDYETVAASNMPTPEQIHSIIDRQRAAASPFAGSSLLNARYGDVPPFSSAWAIGHIGLPFGQNGQIALDGLELPVPADTTFVASLRYTTALRLRIDQLTNSESAARQSAESLNHLLDIFRILQTSQASPPDPLITQFLSSIVIEPHRDRATLNATVPVETLKRLSPSSK